MLRVVGKTLLIVFILWHMFAVAVYSTPRDARDPVGKWMVAHLIRPVAPYLFWTSQWQLWNLFSPDPLRRVTFYHVEAEVNGTWNRIESITPSTLPIWKKSTTLKMMGNLYDENADFREPFIARFLKVQCQKHGIPARAPIRFVYEYFVIPYHKEVQPTAWWLQWEPVPESYVGYTTRCVEP